MKKILSIMVVSVIILTLTVGCRANNATENKTTPTAPDNTHAAGSQVGTETKPSIVEPTTESSAEPGLDVTEPSNVETQQTESTEITTPTKPVEPRLLTFSIDDIEFSFGMRFAEMSKHFSISGGHESGILNVAKNSQETVSIITEDGSSISVSVCNNTNNTLPIEDCLIYSIEVNEYAANNFFFTPTDNSLDMNSSFEDFNNVLGDHAIGSDSGHHSVYAWFWRNSLDQGIISIGIGHNNKTNKIEYICIAYEACKWN